MVAFRLEGNREDTDFGRSMVESVCYQTRPASKLTESEAAEFYLWLIRTFPPTEDPRFLRESHLR